MTPDERFDAHEQWLLDHDKRLAEHAAWQAQMERGLVHIHEILAETSEIQRQQSRVLLDIARHVDRLLDREDES
jgi:hypothetical protein